MMLTAPAAALAEALSLAATAVRGNINLAPVHLVADKGAVSFTCSGPGISIKITAIADIAEPGEVTVAANRLGGLITGFSSSSSITVNTTDNTTQISCGDSRFYLPVLPDVPAALKFDTESTGIEVAGNDLLALLEVVPAASTQTTRFFLTGLYMHSVGDELVAVATDGTRLLRAGIKADHLSTDRRFIVPSKAATALIRLVKQTKPDSVTLRRSYARFAVTGPGFEFVTALIDAKYPDYERLLPRASINVAQCKRSDLIGALARLGAVADGELPLLALSWIDGEPLRLFLPRQPGDAEDRVPAETRGSARLAMSLPQLTAMVSNFPSDRLHLEVTDADGPLMLRGERSKLGILMSCRWTFAEGEKPETEKRPAFARSGAMPNVQ
ncbi:DNA polymerase III subunit beta [Bradyrhizobium erythrophlei]|jgi:DNA polymerase III subunit beta|uniref:Beta sliding clamp n=1 Tax=Bradyrhizobium erythrophlei TaxID=1437360 RepID=A0A1M5XCE6_9BRAD|nr:DNA polymerase III subunit beta [Bradyrhizobium erythrophlei]SHH96863.1 DNA polymerase III, beta subunit [Bradyrhizobium erythrophlei]